VIVIAIKPLPVEPSNLANFVAIVCGRPSEKTISFQALFFCMSVSFSIVSSSANGLASSGVRCLSRSKSLFIFIVL